MVLALAVLVAVKRFSRLATERACHIRDPERVVLCPMLTGPSKPLPQRCNIPKIAGVLDGEAFGEAVVGQRCWPVRSLRLRILGRLSDGLQVEAILPCPMKQRARADVMNFFDTVPRGVGSNFIVFAR